MEVGNTYVEEGAAAANSIQFHTFSHGVRVWRLKTASFEYFFNKWQRYVQRIFGGIKFGSF